MATALVPVTVPTAAEVRPSRRSVAVTAALQGPASGRPTLVQKQVFATSNGSAARLRASQRSQRRWTKTSASRVVCSSAAAAEVRKLPLVRPQAVIGCSSHAHDLRTWALFSIVMGVVEGRR